MYERRGPGESDLERPRIGRGPLSLKRAVKAAIDWETVTPLDQIPRSSIPEPREARAEVVEAQASGGRIHEACGAIRARARLDLRVARGHCRGACMRGDVILHAPSFAFQAPGGGENQLVQSGRHLEELGIPVRLFSAWTDRLERARLLHLFGMSREGLELARVARARGIPVMLSPICWYEPRALAALEADPIRKIAGLAGWALRSRAAQDSELAARVTEEWPSVILPNSRLKRRSSCVCSA